MLKLECAKHKLVFGINIKAGKPPAERDPRLSSRENFPIRRSDGRSAASTSVRVT